MNSDERTLVFEQIRDYLEDYLKTEFFKKGEVTERSLLYHDIGLRGIDAADFMQFIVREFDVDLADFRFKTYFHGEYFGVRDIIRFIFGVYDNSRSPISVGHIVDVCRAKKWTAPPEQCT